MRPAVHPSGARLREVAAEHLLDRRFVGIGARPDDVGELPGIQGKLADLIRRSTMRRSRSISSSVIGARMLSDSLNCAADHHTVHEALNPNLTVAIGNRH